MDRLEKLELKKFKAFKDELIVNFNHKDFLLYGENGSGKSSIYEALKLIFFKEKLIPQSERTAEEQEQLEDDFLSSYNNKSSSDDFEIKINGEEYSGFDIAPYQVFMISYNDIYFGNHINLVELLTKLHFDDVETFCSDFYEIIEEEINEQLVEYFMETIKIKIDPQDDYSIQIKDSERNLEYKNDLRKYFNEARLNLIILLLFLYSARTQKNSQKKRILILDDFITSLDISNRTFLIKYILDFFGDYQKIIFTHNVNLYNLIAYKISMHNDQTPWEFANLYEIAGKNKLYLKSTTETIEIIKSDYEKGVAPEKIGNRIRQKFEVLLYEYSKLLMIGAVEDSKKVLARIENNKSLYLKEKLTASNLVDELVSLLKRNPYPPGLKGILENRINSYSYNEFPNLKKILQDLKIYKKVTMHPMSHGTIGGSTFSTKEIENSLMLLEKLEKHFEKLIGSDVSGI